MMRTGRLGKDCNCASDAGLTVALAAITQSTRIDLADMLFFPEMACAYFVILARASMKVYNTNTSGHMVAGGSVIRSIIISLSQLDDYQPA